MNINKKFDNRGFTIVELLIVIVVIGILAAITIVAYNGIQNRSKLSAAQSAANSVVKKAEAYNSLGNAYPTTVANFDAYPESKVTSSGIGFTATPATGTGTNTVNYQVCTAGGTGVGGARIQYYDYVAGGISTAATSMYTGNLNSSNVAACTTWSTALTLTAGN